MAVCHMNEGKPQTIVFSRPTRGYGAGGGIGCKNRHRTSMACRIPLKVKSLSPFPACGHMNVMQTLMNHTHIKHMYIIMHASMRVYHGTYDF